MTTTTFFFDRPEAHAAFSTPRMGKATLVQGSQMMVGLNAFEPGQEHSAHAHEGVDKLYHVLEGEGEFSVGEERQKLGPGALVWAPAGASHGVRNVGGGRLVVLVVMAPPPR